MSYREIAQARTAGHEKGRNALDKPIFDNTDLIGVIAEGEFARQFNLPFNADIGSEGDGGYDFILPDGRTVDVKGTVRVNGNLLVPAADRKPLKADVYVLAIVDTDEETAAFIGWASQDDVRSSMVKDFGYAYGPAYFVHRSRLRPMNKLSE